MCLGCRCVVNIRVYTTYLSVPLRLILKHSVVIVTCMLRQDAGDDAVAVTSVESMFTPGGLSQGLEWVPRYSDGGLFATARHCETSRDHQPAADLFDRGPEVGTGERIGPGSLKEWRSRANKTKRPSLSWTKSLALGAFIFLRAPNEATMEDQTGFR